MESKVSLLKLVNEHVEWAERKDFDPETYFRTGGGLYVSPEFCSLILSRASRISVSAAVGKSYDLTKDAYDRQVMPELGDAYKFESESELCARVAEMIDKQPNRAAGELCTKGHNIFYATEAVQVCWDYGRRKWHVNAWWLDDGEGWNSSGRVFSRN